MKRNELIKAIEQRIDKAKRAANILKPWISSDSEIDRAWAKVGELEQFGNDLCNAPTEDNRKSGAVCYTLKEAIRKWRSL